MKLNSSELESVARDLLGTCKTTQECLQSLGLEVDAYDHNDLEAQLEEEKEIACCSQCGWWFETNEMVDGICTDDLGENE
jgi:hypothetical protein